MVAAELISLRMAWKMVAETITIMIPAAAHCVHQGLNARDARQRQTDRCQHFGDAEKHAELGRHRGVHLFGDAGGREEDHEAVRQEGEGQEHLQDP